ncbi:MAG TPA: ABC transporter permease [Candidatus Limnocylindrales bacterium]|jgi:spermidine/putrescine transport system permease protein|nr:ABC transporter permease [Candidatus Limnocylindrales bacterium]
MAAQVQTAEEAKGVRGRGKSALLTTALVFPAGLWYMALLVAPLVIVTIFSFGNRAKNGGWDPAFTLDNYSRLLLQPERLEPFITSLWMAVAGTIGCLLVGLPLAYFIATRARKHKGLFILLLVIPFWTSFLIRTYSWLIVLGKENLGGFIGTLVGDPDFRILGTPVAVLVGLVYGYLPLMVFPLYVTLERMDRTLVEASKDLGAARWATFRQITLPIALPGLITGSILVFIPMMGEYVIPQILGYGRTFLAGNALVDAFIQTRNWPFGSAMAVLLIIVMLITITFYVWFVNRGRQGREVSVL